MTSELRVEVDVPLPDDDRGPQVRLLIDGSEALRDVWPDGIGADPDDLIGPFSPLLADEMPRDAVLMRCGCGSRECDCLVANVSRSDGEVIWDGFRMDGEAARTVDAPVFRFDAAAYVSELDRAHREREWESSLRTTGRLVREGLAAARDRLVALGFELDTTWHFDVGEPGIAVSLYEVRDADRRQIVLGFGNDATGAPGAEKIIDLILRTTPGEWPISFRGEWDTR